MKPKTATMADLRNNFRRVSAWLESGESVEITKRGRPFARLVPAVVPPRKTVKIDFAAQLDAVWGDQVFSPLDVRERREVELGDRS